MSATIRAGRRNVEITRPDKVLIPPGVTKADLAGYYEAVAAPMVSHIANRPLNFERFPDGIDGQRIFQQHAAKYYPSWVTRVEVPAAKGTVAHVMARDGATLVYLAGQAVITFHAWLSRSDRLELPDRLVIDLDPSREDPEEVRHAALIMGDLVRELELTPWAMTTGSRGYHVVVPLQRRLEFDGVRQFARDLGELAAARDPELFTTEQRKAKRGGKILIDVLRNAYAHTSVAPYSVRPRPDAPVATPLHWEELEEAATHPRRWTLRTVPDRLERDGDPWRRFSTGAKSLTRARKLLRDALEETRGAT
ncbi:MAG TPA: non-homologous end-joining DNA ligase [Solirubrobacteraceae bacterium]